MYSWFLVIVGLVTVGIALWVLWTVQKAQSRISTTEAEMRDKEAVVGELADELVMASRYLYEAMDNCLQQIERFEERHGSVPTEPAESTTATAQVEASSIETSGPTEPRKYTDIDAASLAFAQASDLTPIEDISTHGPAEEADSYESHFEALALAAEGIESVDIARRTGIGVEELRLLMRFQEELTT